MACNCIKDKQERIFDIVRNNNPERAYSSGVFVNQAYIFDKGYNQLHNLFEAEYTELKKPGKTKVDKINVLMPYCPFCGKSYEEIPSEKETDANTLLDYVQALNHSGGAKRHNWQYTVSLHSNNPEVTYTIMLHWGELKRPILIGMPRDYIVSALKTLTNLLNDEL